MMVQNSVRPSRLRPSLRGLLFVISVLLPSLYWLTGSAHGQNPAPRPNILFVFADDWGRHASCYAALQGTGCLNEGLQTPHIDRVAKAGVLFRHAHVSSPSCTPCRSALLSGQHFWRTKRGAILQGAVWDSTLPAFPLALRDAGYHIGKSFKVWGPGSPSDAPFDGQKHAYQKAGGQFNNFSENVTAATAKGTSLDDAKGKLFHEVRQNFRDFLDARKTTAQPSTEGTQKPFFYWFGSTNTHRRWIKGSGKTLWGLEPDSLKGKLPPFLPDVPEVRQDMTDYFGEVMALDAGIGVLLDELKAQGLEKETLVVLSGDHGAPGFPHGKCNLYDFGTGVSLAIAGPGVAGGRVIDDMVTIPDLAPTFLEAAGVPIPASMTAKSLWPLLRSTKAGQIDPERTWVLTGRERHVENARADFSPYPQRAIQTRDHLLIINFRPDRWPLGDHYGLGDGEKTPSTEDLETETRSSVPDEDAGPTKAWLIGQRQAPQWKDHFHRAYGKRPRIEFYDLRQDPYQMKNLADDPQHHAQRDALEKQLMSELSRTGDPRVTGDGAYFETSPLAGPLVDPQGKIRPGQKPPRSGAPAKAEP